MHKSLVHDGLKVANVLVMFWEQQVVHKLVYAIVVDIAKMTIFWFLRVSRALSFIRICTEIIPKNSVMYILIILYFLCSYFLTDSCHNLGVYHIFIQFV